mgnify:CR=1 FL=1
MSMYKLARGLSSHVIYYHMSIDENIALLPAFEKAALKLTFYLNYAEYQTTDKKKNMYYQKAWKSLIKLETYYDLIVMQEINFKEHLINKYIERIKRALKKKLLEDKISIGQ